MKFSHGHELTAGSSNTILEAPSGYDAVVTYLFVSNIGGSSKDFAARWVHGTTNIDFVAGKNLVPKPPTGKMAFLIFIHKSLKMI